MRRIASILVLLPALALAQTPLTTADDWQAAVQTAAPSSWFAFAAGTYQLTGTPLVVTSGWTRIEGAGPESTYLVAAANTNVVRVTATNVVLAGFTITGGDAAAAAGGVIGHGLTLVTNCVVISNRNVGNNYTAGGLIGCTVFNSTIANNSSTNSGDSGSGGVYFTHAAAVVDSCVVVSNSSKTDGGGVGARYNGRMGSIINSTFRWNYAGGGGGAAHFAYATNSTFEFNSCGTRGGAGIGGYSGFIYAENCVVVSNTSAAFGGGAYSGAARNTLFAHNTAGTTGGGGYGLYGTNLTVRDNVAAQYGGGLHYGLAASSTIERNVANSMSFGGGGAWQTTILYSLIVSNRAAGPFGGGVGDCTVESCAFVDNYATAFGQDLYNSSIVNCTILNTNAAAPVVQRGMFPYKVVANTLIVHASQTNVLDQNGAAWTNVAANYFTNSADGLFLPDDPPYRLPPDSPLIDAGSGDFGSYPFDLWGRPRTYLGGDPDIGATEWTATDLPPDNGAARKRRIIGLLFGKDN